MSSAVRDLDQYDVKGVKDLEGHFAAQVKNQTFDGDANRHLLKLYNCSPDARNKDLVAKILAKALTVSPETQFLQCTYLVPEALHEVEPVKSVLKLANLLETAQFKKFWQERSDAKQLYDALPGFDDAIRQFICLTVAGTYQSLAVSELQQLLNLSERKSVEQLVQRQQWTLIEGGGVVRFPQAPSGEQKPLPAETLTIDQTAKLLATFAS